MASTLVELRAPGGRRIEVLHTELDGRSALVTHSGTPSGLAEWPWFEDLVASAGFGNVTWNRPGYGRSDRRPDQTVATSAEDTACVLDHLGCDRFVSLGISGGGPRALADGALLPDRCLGVVVVAGLAPPDADGLASEGTSEANRGLFEAAAQGPAAVAPIAQGYEAVMAGLTAETLLAVAGSILPEVDAAALADSAGTGLAEYFAAMTAAAFASGPDGLTDDVVAVASPWGFEVASVDVPLTVWHGTLDENVPVAHGRWIVDQVPGAVGNFPEHGHVSILAELPAVVEHLATLARRARRRTNAEVPRGPRR